MGLFKKNKEIVFLNYMLNDIKTEEIPKPIIKTIPEWYKKMPKSYTQNSNIKPTLKSCVPFFDSLSSGYTFTTPCDIHFSIKDGFLIATVSDKEFSEFVEERMPMHNVSVPDGYYSMHFHWYPLFSVKLPKGYSALYTQPLNRFELPFLTTSGIIDNDKLIARGRIPFFLRKGFEGIIPKGTPYVQIIPFKRENWKSKIKNLTQKEFEMLLNLGKNKYRDPQINGYRIKDWVRKIYN